MNAGFPSSILKFLVFRRARTFLAILAMACAWALLSMPVCRANGTKPPANGELFNVNAPTGLGDLKTDAGVTANLTDVKGVKLIKIDFAKLPGYPGVNFPIPAGGWDLSDFTGVQIQVNNAGLQQVTVNMKVENEGDWRNAPWSVDMITVGPGETQTLRVGFGQSFGHPGYKLDPAHVTSIRLYIVPADGPTSLLVGGPTLFKDDSPPPAPPTVSETTAPVAAAPPLPPPPPVKKVPIFPPTPLIDIAGKHDFSAPAAISDSAATLLKGLCPLAEFRALPEVDRHVYSFDPWPSDKESLDPGPYSFNFRLGTEGIPRQKVAFIPEGDNHVLTRATDAATKQSILGGFGNLDWYGICTEVFKFDKPVQAFGVVLRSSGDVDLKRFYWAGAEARNGYPVSYTLADGSVIPLGQRELSAGILKTGTDAYLGVIDHTGRGIVSFTFTVRGLAGDRGQSLNLVNLAFATMPSPAIASIINLKSSCDFDDPDAVTGTPANALKDLASLDAFRFIVANHRYVYGFDTWPEAKPDLGSNTGHFSFDLKGDGQTGQKVTITATNASKTADLVQTTLKDKELIPYHVLGGLGDIGNGAWAEQTFKFEKPVWSFGVTYHSTGDINLAKTGQGATYPVSYTLSNGTVVNLGSPGASGGVISEKGKTFVGVIDKTDKGISSVTFRVQGTADGAQPVYIDNLAFAFAGPPPGKWKLTMDDEFNGDKLDPAHWTAGYLFPDVINNELEGFVPENVTVANGVCTIKVEKRDAVNTDRTGRKGATQKFASGNFTSYGKFTQTYGYFEARIKMPKAPGAGTWPAFWMLPDRGPDFPADRGAYKTKNVGMGSEIDIFEFMPWWKQLDGLFPVHCGTIWSYGPATPEDPDPHGYGSYSLGNDGWGPEEMGFANLDSEFHTYGIYWSPERLIFYVDSKPIFRVRDSKNIPDIPEFFLFNISISGNGWGKNPGGAQPTYQEIIRDMPNKMEIDYFRAYSGTLEEAIPTPPSDMPVIRKYTPPAPVPPPPAPAVTAPAPAPPTNTPPPAPINSTITTPSQ